jgi:DNA-directed RNA polymerase specialized sigma24 family protein
MVSRYERDSFEFFYRGVRDDLLLQTYALTGDLAASEKAVRDALVVAWHHWRKVSQLEDPGNWVRPLAWSRAQRRHTARWWHRQRDLPTEVHATLEALAALTPTQRSVLLLTTLTTQPIERISAEVGLSQAAAERELQVATAQFSQARGVAPLDVGAPVTALRSETRSTRWPRSSILLRAGTARRRSHTVAGIAAVVAATVVVGSLVTDADGVSPVLADKSITSLDRSGRTDAPAVAPAPVLAGDALLLPETVAGVVPGTWTAGPTTRNTEGDGLNVTCQQSRYADPQGVGVLVRTFSAPAATTRIQRQAARRKAVAPATRTAVQSVEASASVTAATAAYDLERQWYAACGTPRVQLVSTHQVDGLGDAASLVVLRSWADPASTLVVGVARTGELTTTVATTTPGVADAALAQSAALLGTAVTQLCAAPGGGTCVSGPRVTEVAPVPLAVAPAMIGELDMPRVGDIDEPWAGTAPIAAATNDAATRCDKADFSRAPFADAQTRSFLIPTDTGLPPEFGLTETVGSLPVARAKRFVANVRERLRTCPDRDLGTEVTTVDRSDAGSSAMTAWTVRVEIAKDRFVDYRMAILRSGTAVAQLGFIAAPRADLTDDSFLALVTRAMQRLANLPARAG